jgi:O-acetylserine/cysteine efflux transporter
MAPTPQDLALLVSITLIWGLNFIASKVGVAEIPPVLFALLRFAVIAVLLAPWLRWHRGQMGALVVAALLGGGLHLALGLAGLHLAGNVSSVAIASQLGVPFTTLMCVALLGETVRWRRWLGIALSFLGVVVMGFDSQVSERPLSLALVIGSAFISSLGVIAVKKLHGFKPLELQAWFACISVPMLLLLSLWLESPRLDALREVSALGWWCLLYTIVFASLIGHTGFYFLLHRYPVTSVAPLTVLTPVFAVVLGVLLLDDQLTARIVIGGTCTLAGVLIIMLRERRMTDIGT